MDVHSIGLRNILSHDATDIDLPDTGLVLVTGPNGAGKSSLAECVAVACWGKTLRGATPWRDGEKCTASVVVDDLWIQRFKTPKGSPKLEWGDGDIGTTTFATTTKAQEALEHNIGPFDVWRRAHVFSSSDAAHFTLATDAERKRLLETVLGLDRFDPALNQCRLDVRRVDGEANKLQGELQRVRLKLEAESRRLDDANAAIAALGPQPTPQLDLVDAAELAKADKDIAELRRRIHDLLGQAEEEREMATECAVKCRQHRAVIQSELPPTCPKCYRPVDDKLRDSIRKSARRAWDKANAAYESFSVAESELQAEVAELRDRLEQARTEHATLVRKREQETVTQRELERWQRQRDLHDKVVTQAKAEIDRLKRKAKKVAKESGEKEGEVATLRAVEKVLGLKGVRAHVLGTALTGLEAMANIWLQRLRCPGLTVKLSPYSERKSGGVSDAISLAVEGAGGGHGYKAASGGERRRIDVALVLALAEVAGAGQGRRVGTLWFDEVFDCLDVDGTEAVAEVLGELARDRCVVVVTHSAALAQLLPGAWRVRVSGGKLEVA